MFHVGVNVIDRAKRAMRKGKKAPQWNMQHPLACKCETEIVQTFAGEIAKHMQMHIHIHIKYK